MRPLLTVAIPTYNGGENLIRAIKSCKYINLPQDKFEILVVDNCSTDGSIEKVKLLQQDFPNIRIVINDKNYGRVGNWNRCIDLAKGKYLIFLFSNDEISPRNKINLLISEMKNKNVVVAVQPFIKRYLNKEQICRLIFKDLKLVNSYEFLLKYINNFSFPFAPIQANIYDLEIIKQYSIYFNEKFDLNGDQLFSIEVVLKSNSILISPFEQVIWNFSHNRFHSKVSIFKVIKDDMVLIELLHKKFNLKINYNNIFCYAFMRVLRNKEWDGKDFIFAYIFIINKIFKNKNFLFIVTCLKKIYKKIKGKINV
jgi:glycosyltransferase involved in cell wall biosynthesis